jgi:hypothetical protein
MAKGIKYADAYPHFKSTGIDFSQPSSYNAVTTKSFGRGPKRRASISHHLVTLSYQKIKP